jgi:hypothetical protein
MIATGFSPVEKNQVQKVQIAKIMTKQNIKNQ